MRVRRNCVQVAGSNLSLLEPAFARVQLTSSATTVRTELAVCDNRVPLAPFQVLYFSYGMTASVMNYSYSLA